MDICYIGGEKLSNIEELYSQHAQVVYRFLYSHTRDENLSEELTQETFFRAIKSLNRYNGKCKISVWLCQIARHVLYQEIAKKSKYKVATIDENYALDFSVEETIISSENKKELYKSIQFLDATTREVLYLRLTGDLSFREIGEILNRTENWARVTFFRGKSKIAGMMQKEEER